MVYYSLLNFNRFNLFLNKNSKYKIYFSCRYRSIPPVNTLILTSGIAPFMGFHYAVEGGTTPPLQDVARAVAYKIKSALP